MPTRKAIWCSVDTYMICDSPIKRSALRSLTQLKKSRRSHNILICEQKPYGVRVGSAKDTRFSVNIVLR